MKVAIQLFGHLRSYEKVQPYFKAHITDWYDCDIFIHTWSEEEHSDPSWHKRPEDKQTVNQTDVSKLSKLYAPKALEVEDNSIIDFQGFFNPNRDISLRGMKAMSYSQFKVNQLRKGYAERHNIKYDLVIMLRPDVMPLAKLDIERFLCEFDYNESSTVHFSSGSHQHTQGVKKISTPLASDLFYIAKPKTLDCFLDEKNQNFTRYYVDFSDVNIGGISAPEASFLEALLVSGGLPRFYSFPYAVIRTFGSNHIKANFSSISEYTSYMSIPDYLLDKENEIKNTLSYRLLSRFNHQFIEKIQKQLKRTTRQLDAIIDKLQKIIESK